MCEFNRTPLFLKNIPAIDVLADELRAPEDLGGPH